MSFLQPDKLISRAIAFLVFIAFLSSCTLTYASSAYELSSSSAVEIRLSKFADSIAIPQELGRLRKSEAVKGSRLAFHIQDAHSQLDAQVNIEKLIDLLTTHYGAKTIFVEGGLAGSINPDLIRFFDDEKQNESFARELLKKGFITGPGMFLLKNPNIKFFGVEDKELYQEHISVFRKIYESKSETDSELKRIWSDLETKASKSLNLDLRKFLKDWLFFQDSKRDLLAHINILDELAREHLRLNIHDARNQLGYPQLVRFAKLKDLEKEGKINAENLEQEQVKLLEWLSRNGLHAFKDQLNSRFENANSREQKIPLRTFLETFYESAHTKGFAFQDYPQLTRWFSERILTEELDSELLFTEIEKVVERLFKALAKTAAEKEFIDSVKSFLLLRKLLSLELTRDDWEVVKNAVIASDERSSERGNLAFARLLRTFGARNDYALRFYQLAEEREQVIAQNIEKILKQTKDDKFILVSGGFHEEGFERLFRREKISVISISPRIAELDSDVNYLQVMLAQSKSATLAAETLDKIALPDMTEPSRAFFERELIASLPRSELRSKERKRFDLHATTQHIISLFKNNPDCTQLPTQTELSSDLGPSQETFSNHFPEILTALRQEINQEGFDAELKKRIKRAIDSRKARYGYRSELRLFNPQAINEGAGDSVSYVHQTNTHLRETRRLPKLLWLYPFSTFLSWLVESSNPQRIISQAKKPNQSEVAWQAFQRIERQLVRQIGFLQNPSPFLRLFLFGLNQTFVLPLFLILESIINSTNNQLKYIKNEIIRNKIRDEINSWEARYRSELRSDNEVMSNPSAEQKISGEALLLTKTEARLLRVARNWAGLVKIFIPFSYTVNDHLNTIARKLIWTLESKEESSESKLDAIQNLKVIAPVILTRPLFVGRVFGLSKRDFLRSIKNALKDQDEKVRRSVWSLLVMILHRNLDFQFDLIFDEELAFYLSGAEPYEQEWRRFYLEELIAPIASGKIPFSNRRIFSKFEQIAIVQLMYSENPKQRQMGFAAASRIFNSNFYSSLAESVIAKTLEAEHAPHAPSQITLDALDYWNQLIDHELSVGNTSAFNSMIRLAKLTSSDSELARKIEPILRKILERPDIGAVLTIELVHSFRESDPIPTFLKNTVESAFLAWVDAPKEVLIKDWQSASRTLTGLFTPKRFLLSRLFADTNRKRNIHHERPALLSEDQLIKIDVAFNQFFVRYLQSFIRPGAFMRIKVWIALQVAKGREITIQELQAKLREVIFDEYAHKFESQEPIERGLLMGAELHTNTALKRGQSKKSRELALNLYDLMLYLVDVPGNRYRVTKEDGQEALESFAVTDIEERILNITPSFEVADPEKLDASLLEIQTLPAFAPETHAEILQNLRELIQILTEGHDVMLGDPKVLTYDSKTDTHSLEQHLSVSGEVLVYEVADVFFGMSAFNWIGRRAANGDLYVAENLNPVHFSFRDRNTRAGGKRSEFAHASDYSLSSDLTRKEEFDELNLRSFRIFKALTFELKFQSQAAKDYVALLRSLGLQGNANVVDLRATIESAFKLQSALAPDSPILKIQAAVQKVLAAYQARVDLAKAQDGSARTVTDGLLPATRSELRKIRSNDNKNLIRRNRLWKEREAGQVTRQQLADSFNRSLNWVSEFEKDPRFYEVPTIKMVNKQLTKLIGKRLEQRRTEARISSHAVAQLIGITAQEYRRVELGRRSLDALRLKEIHDHITVTQGQILKRRREAIRLTQVELAEETKKMKQSVGQSQIDFIERGKATYSNLPSILHLTIDRVKNRLIEDRRIKAGISKRQIAKELGLKGYHAIYKYEPRKVHEAIDRLEGANFRQFRLAAQISLSDLSKATGILNDILSLMERGKKGIPLKDSQNIRSILIQMAREKLRARRKSGNISVSELAKESKHHDSYIVGIEQGKFMPSPQSLSDLHEKVTIISGQKIKEQREAGRITILELAQKAGIDEMTLSRVEKGITWLSPREMTDAFRVLRKMIGEKIKKERKKLGLSQRSLASISDIGIRTVYVLESGRDAADIDVVYLVFAALDLMKQERRSRTQKARLKETPTAFENALLTRPRNNDQEDDEGRERRQHAISQQREAIQELLPQIEPPAVRKIVEMVLDGEESRVIANKLRFPNRLFRALYASAIEQLRLKVRFVKSTLNAVAANALSELPSSRIEPMTAQDDGATHRRSELRGQVLFSALIGLALRTSVFLTLFIPIWRFILRPLTTFTHELGHRILPSLIPHLYVKHAQIEMSYFERLGNFLTSPSIENLKLFWYNAVGSGHTSYIYTPGYAPADVSLTLSYLVGPALDVIAASALLLYALPRVSGKVSEIIKIRRLPNWKKSFVLIAQGWFLAWGVLWWRDLIGQVNINGNDYLNASKVSGIPILSIYLSFVAAPLFIYVWTRISNASRWFKYSTSLGLAVGFSVFAFAFYPLMNPVITVLVFVPTAMVALAWIGYRYVMQFEQNESKARALRPRTVIKMLAAFLIWFSHAAGIAGVTFKGKDLFRGTQSGVYGSLNQQFARVSDWILEGEGGKVIKFLEFLRDNDFGYQTPVEFIFQSLIDGTHAIEIVDFVEKLTKEDAARLGLYMRDETNLSDVIKAAQFDKKLMEASSRVYYRTGKSSLRLEAVSTVISMIREFRDQHNPSIHPRILHAYLRKFFKVNHALDDFEALMRDVKKWDFEIWTEMQEPTPLLGSSDTQRSELRTGISYAEFEKIFADYKIYREKLRQSRKSGDHGNYSELENEQRRLEADLKEIAFEDFQVFVREYILKDEQSALDKVSLFESIAQFLFRDEEEFFGRYILPAYLSKANSDEENEKLFEIALVLVQRQFGLGRIHHSLSKAFRDSDSESSYKLTRLLLRIKPTQSSFKYLTSVLRDNPFDFRITAYVLAAGFLIGRETEDLRVRDRYFVHLFSEIASPDFKPAYFYLLKLYEVVRKSGAHEGRAASDIIYLSRLLDNDSSFPGERGQTWFSAFREVLHTNIRRSHLNDVRSILRFLITKDKAELKSEWEFISRFADDLSADEISAYFEIFSNFVTNPGTFLQDILKISSEELPDLIRKANSNAKERYLAKATQLLQLYLAMVDYFETNRGAILSFLKSDDSIPEVAAYKQSELDSITQFMREGFDRMTNVLDSKDDLLVLSEVNQVRNDIKEFLLSGSEKRKADSGSDLWDDAEHVRSVLDINHKLSILAQERMANMESEISAISSLDDLKKALPKLVALGKFLQSSGLGGVDFDDLFYELQFGAIKLSQLHDLVRILQAEVHKMTRGINDLMRAPAQSLLQELEYYDLEGEWKAHTSFFETQHVEEYGKIYEKRILTEAGKEKLQNLLVDDFIRTSGAPLFDRALMKFDEILSKHLRSEKDEWIRASESNAQSTDLSAHFYRFGKDAESSGQAPLLSTWSKKGLNLVRMTREGIAVPPGVILSAELMTRPAVFRSDSFRLKVEEEIARLRQNSNYPDLKLILYARSGSAFMLPGLLATVTNIGMNDAEAEALAKSSGDAWFAYNTYAEFIRSFATHVLGIDSNEFEQVLNVRDSDSLSADEMKTVVSEYKQILLRHGKVIPDAMMDQVMMAVEAVYASWDSEEARAYRKRHDISQEWGTVVILQKGVFGNLSPTEEGKVSGTGHAVLRTLPDGREVLQGKFRFRSIGDQLMSHAGQNYILMSNVERRHPDEQTIEDLQPGLFAELFTQAQRLQQIFRYSQQFEFTVERGQVWIVQSNDDFLIDRYPSFVDSDNFHPIARGHGVSGGAVRGLVANSIEKARVLLESLKANPRSDVDGVILILGRVNPEMVNQIPKGVHVLARTISVHAETLAQKEGISAVYGIPDMIFDEEKKIRKIAGHELEDGTLISMDGHENPLLYHQSGNLYLGSVPLKPTQNTRSELRRFSETFYDDARPRSKEPRTQLQSKVSYTPLTFQTHSPLLTEGYSKTPVNASTAAIIANDNRNALPVFSKKFDAKAAATKMYKRFANIPAINFLLASPSHLFCTVFYHIINLLKVNNYFAIKHNNTSTRSELRGQTPKIPLLLKKHREQIRGLNSAQASFSKDNSSNVRAELRVAKEDVQNIFHSFETLLEAVKKPALQDKNKEVYRNAVNEVKNFFSSEAFHSLEKTVIRILFPVRDRDESLGARPEYQNFDLLRDIDERTHRIRASLGSFDKALFPNERSAEAEEVFKLIDRFTSQFPRSGNETDQTAFFLWDWKIQRIGQLAERLLAEPESDDDRRWERLAIIHAALIGEDLFRKESSAPINQTVSSAVVNEIKELAKELQLTDFESYPILQKRFERARRSLEQLSEVIQKTLEKNTTEGTDRVDSIRFLEMAYFNVNKILWQLYFQMGKTELKRFSEMHKKIVSDKDIEFYFSNENEIAKHRDLSDEYIDKSREYLEKAFSWYLKRIGEGKYVPLQSEYAALAEAEYERVRMIQDIYGLNDSEIVKELEHMNQDWERSYSEGNQYPLGTHIDRIGRFLAIQKISFANHLIHEGIKAKSVHRMIGSGFDSDTVRSVTFRHVSVSAIIRFLMLYRLSGDSSLETELWKAIADRNLDSIKDIFERTESDDKIRAKAESILDKLTSLETKQQDKRKKLRVHLLAAEAGWANEPVGLAGDPNDLEIENLIRERRRSKVSQSLTSLPVQRERLHAYIDKSLNQYLLRFIVNEPHFSGRENAVLTLALLYWEEGFELWHEKLGSKMGGANLSKVIGYWLQNGLFYRMTKNQYDRSTLKSSIDIVQTLENDEFTSQHIGGDRLVLERLFILLGLIEEEGDFDVMRELSGVDSEEPNRVTPVAPAPAEVPTNLLPAEPEPSAETLAETLLAPPAPEPVEPIKPLISHKVIPLPEHVRAELEGVHEDSPTKYLDRIDIVARARNLNMSALLKRFNTVRNSNETMPSFEKQLQKRKGERLRLEFQESWFPIIAKILQVPTELLLWGVIEGELPEDTFAPEPVELALRRIAAAKRQRRTDEGLPPATRLPAVASSPSIVSVVIQPPRPDPMLEAAKIEVRNILTPELLKRAKIIREMGPDPTDPGESDFAYLRIELYKQWAKRKGYQISDVTGEPIQERNQKIRMRKLLGIGLKSDGSEFDAWMKKKENQETARIELTFEAPSDFDYYELLLDEQSRVLFKELFEWLAEVDLKFWNSLQFLEDDEARMLAIYDDASAKELSDDLTTSLARVLIRLKEKQAARETVVPAPQSVSRPSGDATFENRIRFLSEIPAYLRISLYIKWTEIRKIARYYSALDPENIKKDRNNAKELFGLQESGKSFIVKAVPERAGFLKLLAQEEYDSIFDTIFNWLASADEKKWDSLGFKSSEEKTRVRELHKSLFQEMRSASPTSNPSKMRAELRASVFKNLAENDQLIPVAIKYLDIFTHLETDPKIRYEDETGFSEHFGLRVPDGKNVYLEVPNQPEKLILSINPKVNGVVVPGLAQETDHPVTLEFDSDGNVIAVYIIINQETKQSLKLQILQQKPGRAITPFDLRAHLYEGPRSLIFPLPKSEIILKASLETNFDRLQDARSEMRKAVKVNLTLVDFFDRDKTFFVIANPMFMIGYLNRKRSERRFDHSDVFLNVRQATINAVQFLKFFLHLIESLAKYFELASKVFKHYGEFSPFGIVRINIFIFVHGGMITSLGSFVKLFFSNYLFHINDIKELDKMQKGKETARSELRSANENEWSAEEVFYEAREHLRTANWPDNGIKNFVSDFIKFHRDRLSAALFFLTWPDNFNRWQESLTSDEKEYIHLRYQRAVPDALFAKSHDDLELRKAAFVRLSDKLFSQAKAFQELQIQNGMPITFSHSKVRSLLYQADYAAEVSTHFYTALARFKDDSNALVLAVFAHGKWWAGDQDAILAQLSELPDLSTEDEMLIVYQTHLSAPLITEEPAATTSKLPPPLKPIEPRPPAVKRYAGVLSLHSAHKLYIPRESGKVILRFYPNGDYVNGRDLVFIVKEKLKQKSAALLRFLSQSQLFYAYFVKADGSLERIDGYSGFALSRGRVLELHADGKTLKITHDSSNENHFIFKLETTEPANFTVIVGPNKPNSPRSELRVLNPPVKVGSEVLADIQKRFQKVLRHVQGNRDLIIQYPETKVWLLPLLDEIRLDLEAAMNDAENEAWVASKLYGIIFKMRIINVDTKMKELKDWNSARQSIQTWSRRLGRETLPLSLFDFVINPKLRGGRWNLAAENHFEQLLAKLYGITFDELAAQIASTDKDERYWAPISWKQLGHSLPRIKDARKAKEVMRDILQIRYGNTLRYKGHDRGLKNWAWMIHYYSVIASESKKRSELRSERPEINIRDYPAPNHVSGPLLGDSEFLQPIKREVRRVLPQFSRPSDRQVARVQRTEEQLKWQKQKDQFQFFVDLIDNKWYAVRWNKNAKKLTKDYVMFNMERGAEEGAYVYTNGLLAYRLTLPSAVRHMRQSQILDVNKMRGSMNEILPLIGQLVRRPDLIYYWLGYDDQNSEFTMHEAVPDKNGAYQKIVVSKSTLDPNASRQIADFVGVDSMGNMVSVGEAGLHRYSDLARKFANTIEIFYRAGKLGDALYLFTDEISEAGDILRPVGEQEQSVIRKMLDTLEEREKRESAQWKLPAIIQMEHRFGSVVRIFNVPHGSPRRVQMSDQAIPVPWAGEPTHYQDLARTLRFMRIQKKSLMLEIKRAKAGPAPFKARQAAQFPEELLNEIKQRDPQLLVFASAAALALNKGIIRLEVLELLVRRMAEGRNVLILTYGPHFDWYLVNAIRTYLLTHPHFNSNPEIAAKIFSRLYLASDYTGYVYGFRNGWPHAFSRPDSSHFDSYILKNREVITNAMYKVGRELSVAIRSIRSGRGSLAVHFAEPKVGWQKRFEFVRRLREELKDYRLQINATSSHSVVISALDRASVIRYVMQDELGLTQNQMVIAASSVNTRYEINGRIITQFPEALHIFTGDQLFMPMVTIPRNVSVWPAPVKGHEGTLAILKALPNQSSGVRSELRVKSSEQPVHNYETLLNALKSGIPLIEKTDQAVVETKEWGRIDLNRLNSLSNYQGPSGIFYLARDLQVAVDYGMIKMSLNKKQQVNQQKLNSLSKWKTGKLKLKSQILHWRNYFKTQTELNEHPGEYQEDEGQIKLARKMKINSISHLYSAFGGRGNPYKWTQILLTLEDLDRVQTELNEHPGEYQEDEGQIKLARKMKINSISHLYSAFGGRRNPYKWTQILLTLEDLDRVLSEYQGSASNWTEFLDSLNLPKWKHDQLNRLFNLGIITRAELRLSNVSIGSRVDVAHAAEGTIDIHLAPEIRNQVYAALFPSVNLLTEENAGENARLAIPNSVRKITSVVAVPQNLTQLQLENLIRGAVVALNQMNPSHEIIFTLEGNIQEFQRAFDRSLGKIQHEINLPIDLLKSIRARIRFVADGHVNLDLLSGREVVLVGNSVIPKKDFIIHRLVTNRLMNGDPLSTDDISDSIGSFVTGSFEMLLHPIHDQEYFVRSINGNWYARSKQSLGLIQSLIDVMIQNRIVLQAA